MKPPHEWIDDDQHPRVEGPEVGAIISGEKVAIVGSRDYPRLDKVRAYVHGLPPRTLVISGGARGVDCQAEGEARALGLPVLIFRPDWKLGRRAGLLRNHEIVKAADRVVAFWDGQSSGTAFTMQLARVVYKKPLEVIEA